MSLLVPELLHELLICRDSAQVDAIVVSVMERIGGAQGASRVLVQEFDDACWSCRCEWHAPGLAQVGPRLRALPMAAFPAESARLLAGEPLAPGPTAELPPGPLRALLTELGIARMIALPFTADPRCRGALVLALDAARPGPDAAGMRLLAILADGINAALARHRAESALEASRREQAATLARLRATLSSTPDLLLELDDEGRCRDSHCSRPDLLAASTDLILGKTLEETLPPEVAALQRRAMAAARRDGIAEAPRYALGEGAARRWFHLTAVRREAIPEAGIAAGFVFRIRDVSAEHDRERRERLLAGIVADMPLMIALIDPHARIEWANATFEDQFGLPAAQLRGQPMRRFSEADPSTPGFMAAITRAIAARESFQGVACRRIRGERRWTDVMLRPHTDPDGAFAGFISIERDITERCQAEAERARLAAEAEAARARLHTAIEALDDGFVMLDAEGRLLLCNSRFREIHAPVAHLLEPGRPLRDMLRAGQKAGLFALPPPSLRGTEPAIRRVEELTYADGRTYRVTTTRSGDGGYVGLHSDITAIRDARQRLADVIDGARAATWDLDLATGLTTVNRHWLAMMGFPPERSCVFTSAEWLALCHPDCVPGISSRLSDVQDGARDSVESENRRLHADGRWVHVITRGQVVARAPDGQALRMSGVDIDITERRMVEDRLQTILDASAVGTWLLDAATGETLIDDSYARLVGYRLRDLQPMTRQRFESMIHPDDLGTIYDRIREAARAGRTWITHEFRMRHRDGGWRWILSKARIHEWAPDGSGPLRESGVHIDITEARAREAALAEARDALSAEMTARLEAERRMADIAAVSDDWFWEQDAELRFTYVSQGFERSTGLRPDQVLGRRLSDLRLLGVGASRDDWARLRAAFLARARFTDFVCRHTPADQPGETFWARISGAPFSDAEGSFAGYRGVGANVRTLIEATERAEAASRAKSQFLATMSHELRTPLTAVLGLTELMQDQVREPELRGMLDTIRESGAGLLAVLDDILDLAKIEAGKLTLDPAPFVPADLARRCEALFRPRAETAGLTMTVTAAPDCAQPRLGDANRVLQILNNLIGNAIKFTETGGIRVRIAPGGEGRLRFVVEDDGIGMTEDQLARVFDEFEQAEGSTARRFGGTGLGLPITRRLVQLLGGTLELRSAPGRGTQVEFDLPLPPADPPAADPPVAGAALAREGGADRTPAPARDPASDPASDLAGLRVLVADDNQTNRRILAAMLGGLGLAVTLAEDGRAALSHYRPGAFDLLLLDISMPELDGPAALAAMRAVDAQAAAAPPPALAVTAHAMAHQVEEFLVAGFAGHIAKPFTRASLAEALVRHRP